MPRHALTTQYGLCLQPAACRIDGADLIIALCDDCRAEMEDPSNRRADYPFINCTQCGPRYSIIERIPYDRPATTMRAFLMCQACKTEYEDPESRRFHAQPNACPCCGPRVSIRSASAANPDGRDPFAQASRLILGGAVVAVHGIGGYHLMVDATNEVAVRELRRRRRVLVRLRARKAPSARSIDHPSPRKPPPSSAHRREHASGQAHRPRRYGRALAKYRGAILRGSEGARCREGVRPIPCAP